METLSFPFIVSVVSAITSGTFAAIVLNRWRIKHRAYNLAWGIGLLFYCLGTLSQVILALTWSPFFFRVWYWTGALAVAPWLGQGTVYLLVRRGSVAKYINMAVLLISIMTFLWMFITPLDGSHWYPGADMTQIYGDVMGPSRGSVRSFSPLMNVWGTIALVGGAIWSAWLFRRKEIMRNRVIGNWLIAAGGLLPAFGGALIRLGNPAFKYTGEMLGAILIFAGFYLATRYEPEESPAPQPELSKPLETTS